MNKKNKSVCADMAILNENTAVCYLRNVWTNTISEKESLYLVSLDEWGRVISCDCVSTGNQNSCFFEINVAIGIAVKHNAKKIIVAHNHPSGNPDPSNQDLKITKELQLTCKCVGIELFDHIILTPGSMVFSFKRDGLLEVFERQNSRIFNMQNPDSFEYQVLQLMDLSFKQRSQGSNPDFITNIVNKVLDRLYIKFFDPISFDVSDISKIRLT